MKKDIDANIKYYNSLYKNGDIASKLDKYYQQNREKGIIKLIICKETSIKKIGNRIITI